MDKGGDALTREQLIKLDWILVYKPELLRQEIWLNPNHIPVVVTFDVEHNIVEDMYIQVSTIVE
jgi:hypothetical protein